MSTTRAPHRLPALAVLALVAACGPDAGPPQIVLDRSVCDRCGMLISDPRFAAAYRADGDTAVFDDVGCLLDALEEAGLAPASSAQVGQADAGAAGTAEIWFHDAEGRWIQAADAVFIRAETLATPMGGGIQALADRVEAERLAARVGGTVVADLEELRATRRASGGAPSEEVNR